jgi:hypothetical protein
MSSAAGVVGPFAPLADDLRADLRRVVGRDDLLERARREHVAVDEQHVVVRDRLGTAEPGDAPRLLLVREHR